MACTYCSLQLPCSSQGTLKIGEIEIGKDIDEWSLRPICFVFISVFAPTPLVLAIFDLDHIKHVHRKSDSVVRSAFSMLMIEHTTDTLMRPTH